MKETRCKACGRRIAFVYTPGGKALPLDLVAPVYQVVRDVDSGKISAERLQAAHVSHFATCSDPGRFSKSRRSGAST